MFEVLDPGLFTTVQDLGRVGFQKYGVSGGGAMDTLALRAANRLVGNQDHAAALEITLTGPRLRTTEKCLVAVAGARFELLVSGHPAPPNTALFLRAGAVLEFGAREEGARAYLAVAGGVDVPLVMGSRSTDVRGGFGGYQGRTLRTGDEVEALASRLSLERAGASLRSSFEAHYQSTHPIRVILGPHDEFFPAWAREELENTEFVISDESDRMAWRLKGGPLEREPRELLSCGVTLGAIQVPPDGQPILLMADRQPTGGYPVIATVIRADLSRLAQRIAGERIRFRAVSVEEAERTEIALEVLLEAIPPENGALRNYSDSS